MPPVTHCFVCTRCEYPICTRDDVLSTAVSQGTTSGSFEYDLEDLLNVEDSVPCYSGAEVTEVSVAVSERILSMPLPPAARLLALEAVVESQRNYLGEVNEQQRLLQQQQRRLQELRQQHQQQTEEQQQQQVETRGEGGNVLADGDNNVDTSRDEQPRNSEEGVRAPLASRLARFGRVAESRIDLVCVRADVTGLGLAVCSKDRSADVPPTTTKEKTPSSRSSSSSSGNSGSGLERERDRERPHRRAATGSSMPSAILSAARQPPPPTQWASHPGNFLVEEAFVQVRRRTKTSKMPWFSAYKCSQRLECPDCHLGLGFLFTRHAAQDFNSGNNNETVGTSTMTTASPGAEANPVVREENMSQEAESREDAHEPHPKRERHEGTLLADGGDGNANVEGQEKGRAHPDTFIGLELKKIRENNWGLRDFQQRYHQSQSLKSFRALFPEAEELESLYSRLTALRTQSELYNNLISKHKEQNDVQSALLQSQKERINTYEEKLRTMQQIIEAQRAQLEMQGRQIKHQEQLVRNHKSQVLTQQHQIQVEQLLLSEQSRTINSQREQLSLMQVHLRARLVREQLEMRCGQVNSVLQLAAERRQQEQLSERGNSRDRETTEEEDEEEQKLDSSAPPINNTGLSTSRSFLTHSLENPIGGLSNTPLSQEEHHGSLVHSESATDRLVRSRERSEQTAAILQRIAEERLRRRPAAATVTDSSAKTPKMEYGNRSDGDVARGGGNRSHSNDSSTSTPLRRGNSSVSNDSSNSSRAFP